MELHDDDKPVGRILSRREVMKLLGGGSAILLTGFSLSHLIKAQDGTATPSATAEPLPSCIVRPAKTEGPFFVDDDLNRFDIRADPVTGIVKDGALLHLKFLVSAITADGCMPLEGAQVDIWHCDALGAYSGVADRTNNTRGEKWLRGYQITDEEGVAEFLTIYPGWYPGRAVHIHFKIRAENDYEFTSQLFFTEEMNDLVHAGQPYDTKGTRNTYNRNDGIYANGGDQLLLELDEISAEDITAAALAAHQRNQALTLSGTPEATPEPTPESTPEITFENGGYSAIFTIGLDLSE
jgi:protocatechuate 3,4-dioxygenase beta subunit